MAEAEPSNAVVPAAEPEVDLAVHPSGIVPQLQVRRRVRRRVSALTWLSLPRPTPAAVPSALQARALAAADRPVSLAAALGAPARLPPWPTTSAAATAAAPTHPPPSPLCLPPCRTWWPR